MRAFWLVIAMLAGCEASKSRQLDHDLVHVSPGAELRTDTVGDGKFTDTATFVLVDAENTASEGAYVTLGGELDDASGAKVAELRPQSLWIPARASRTFALIDRDRQPRPTAARATLYVRGAVIQQPPVADITTQREVTDDGKIVVQGTLANPAARGASVLVIASFHDADGRPMTRPFALVHVEPGASQAVQFVGPPGSKHGQLFVGDEVY
ncbi:MAG TPA: hypothetical protein VLX92_32655 [Kofleriaceae bacterium]|nr:hypothetical protein [Kofleriaceae bacterium]